MNELHYLPSFEKDLEKIWLDIAPENMVAADGLVDRLYARCKDLIDFPKLGPARPDIASDCRHLVERNCIILYRITRKKIELVRVFRGGKKLGPDLFHTRLSG